MNTLHEPIPVTYRSHGNMFGPEPRLPDDAPPLDRLRWNAGCVEARTGLRILISEGGYWSNGRAVPNSYGLSFGHSAIGPIVGFREAWAAINHLGAGYEAAKGALWRPGDPDQQPATQPEGADQ